MTPTVPVREALLLEVELSDNQLDKLADLLLPRLCERIGVNTGTADSWLRGASAIAAYIGAPASRVYSLASARPPRIPVERDGTALVARRSDLDAWLANGGGKRP